MNNDQIIHLQKLASGWAGIAAGEHELLILLENHPTSRCMHPGYAINAQNQARTYSTQIRKELGIE